MIDRAEVEMMIGWAERNKYGSCPPIYADQLAELARVYLAWLDAPEREVGDCCGHSTVDTSYDLPDEVQAAQTKEVQALVGQTVRLVATPASGGPRE